MTPKLHHYAFDLHALQDLVEIADGLVVKGRRLLWGPGRHGAGGNVFQYYIDPNNCVVDMSVGMDRIENDAMYEVRNWDFTSTMSGAWINLWGSPPPAISRCPASCSGLTPSNTPDVRRYHRRRIERLRREATACKETAQSNHAPGDIPWLA